MLEWEPLTAALCYAGATVERCLTQRVLLAMWSVGGTLPATACATALYCAGDVLAERCLGQCVLLRCAVVVLVKHCLTQHVLLAM